MPLPCVTSIRQFQALWLTSLYALTPPLAGTALMWGTHATISQPSAQSQTLPSLQPSPSPRPTTQQLLEEAKQRLRDRGELPPASPNPTPAQPDLLPTPAQLPEAPPKPPLSFYRLGPGDGIGIFVERFQDLSLQTVIDLEGNITMPLLGKVPLEGLTLLEAQERLRVGLNRYVIDPTVLIALIRQRPIQITIIGEVSEPGFYSLGGAGTTGALAYARVSTALLAAGGTTERADLRAIRVRRMLMDGSFIEQSLDLFTPLKNGDALPDLNLQDRDAVIVPKLQTDALQDYDRTLVARSTLAQQQINIRVLSYAGGGVATLRLANGSTFLDALTAIGPNPDTADLGNIALIRFDPEQGKAVTRQVNGGNVLRGDVTQNVPLENNDVIVIGRNLVGQITYALNVFTQPFRDILGFLLFFDSLANSAENIFSPTGTRR